MARTRSRWGRRWSSKLSDRYERTHGLWSRVVEPQRFPTGWADLAGLQVLDSEGDGAGLPIVDLPSGLRDFGTELIVEPRNVRAESNLLAEFEGVLAFRRVRRRGAARSHLVLVRPDEVLSPEERPALNDVGDLAWLVWGDVVASSEPDRLALRSLGFAPLPNTSTRGVTGDLLRAVPTEELLRIAERKLRQLGEWREVLRRLTSARGQEVRVKPGAYDDALEHALGSVPTNPRKPGRPIDRAHYEEVARRVRQIQDEGQLGGIARRLSEERKVPYVTAYRWIQTARSLGLLPGGGPDDEQSEGEGDG